MKLGSAVSLCSGCALGLALAAGASAQSAANLAPPPPHGWESWSPRPELAPAADTVPAEGGVGLRMRSQGAADYGEWHDTVGGIQGGDAYHFEVRYRPDGIAYEGESVPVILAWLTSAGKPIHYDYVTDISKVADGWRTASKTLTAPAAAASVAIKLILRWTAAGSVVWEAPVLERVPAPRHRLVRVVTTCIPPYPDPTVESNRALMRKTLAEAGALQPDIVLFTEVFADRGVPLPVTETAETIPGPTTDMLAEGARRYHTYVATSIHERDHGLIYNTGVLIDRQGQVVGKYHKVHLVLPEAEEGITPGSGYPVFQTDFGRVGIMVCWDDWFPETARILRLNGAEIILLPLAGDGDGMPDHWDVISRARAFDNSVFFVASSAHIHSPSVIIDPNGKLLAATDGGIASVDIDLDQVTRLHGFEPGNATGTPRDVYIRDRHPETYGPLSQDH